MTENPIPWRVIRAAPDLLEALEALMGFAQDRANIPGMTAFPVWDKARAAIAKAKGGDNEVVDVGGDLLAALEWIARPATTPASARATAQVAIAKAKGEKE